MKTSFLYFLVLLTVCNIPLLHAQQRIIGGQSIDISQAPYQIAIFTDSGFGGGVIINNQWILTAAHVVKNKSMSSITISMGHTDPMSDTSRSQVSQVILHNEGDIALLKLSSPITFTETIQPVAIVNAQYYAANTYGIVTGWGRTSINGTSPSSQLYQCSMRVKSCANKEIIAVPSSSTPYRGDSGGPLTTTSSTGNTILIGLVSHGDYANPTSSSTYYVNVGAYYGWIDSYVDLYTISGTSLVCGTATFKISAPGNCTFDLSPNLQLVSQTSNSLVVSKTANGRAFINMMVGKTILLQNQFWAGVPIVAGVTCNGGYLKAETLGLNAHINRTEWTIGGTTFTSSSETLWSPYTSGTYTIAITASNSCGTGLPYRGQITFSQSKRYRISEINESRQVTLSPVENERGDAADRKTLSNFTEAKYTLVSLLQGTMADTGSFPPEGGLLDFSKVPSDTYVLTLFLEDGIEESFKILLK